MSAEFRRPNAVRRRLGGAARGRLSAVLEEFEPRLLYSADVAAVALASAGPAPSDTPDTSGTSIVGQWQQQSASGTHATMPASPLREIAFVDLAVTDAAALLAGLRAQAEGGRPIEIVTIGAGEDGLAVIDRTLADRQDLSAVHIVSHGRAADLMLGASHLDTATMTARAGAIAQWGQALQADADILIYGCEVGAGAAGAQWVQSLAALTGADVAASEDATGSAALGGDFDLERQVGPVEAPVALSQASLGAWQGLLAATMVADSYNVEPSTVTPLNVLANDGSTNGGTPIVLDATTPAKGTIALPGAVAGGTITYTSGAATGSDSFQYLADDGKSGLVNYWRMEGSPNDLFSRAATTASGTTQYAPGDLGRGMLFSGDDKLDISGLTNTSTLSLVMRFRYDDSNTGNGWRTLWTQAPDTSDTGNNRLSVYIVGSGQTGSFANNLVIQLGDGSTAAQTYYPDNAIKIPASRVIQNGWHQLTISIDSSGTKVYLDGDTSPTGSSTIGRSNLNLPTTARIGQDLTGRANSFFKGMIDSVARYNVALTGAQSAALYSRSGLLTNVAINVVPANLSAPVIQVPTTATSWSTSIAEGSTAVTTITATDADATSVVRYSISGGADAGRFTINATTGALAFLAAPDYERPTDLGASNVYDVTVAASDGKFTDTLAIAVAVTNVREPLQTVSDGVTTTPLQTVTLDVLANDRFPEGNAPQLLEVSTPTTGSAAIVGTQLQYTADASTLGAIPIRYLASNSSDGLTHYFRLDGDATDLIAAGGTVPVLTNTSTTSGRWGQALAFDGSAFVQLDNPIGAGVQGRTISLWFRIDPTKASQAHTLLSLGDVRTGSGIEIGLMGSAGGSKLQAQVRDVDDAGNPAALQFDSAGVTDGNWHQITLVLDPTSGSQLYLDGALKASDAARGTGAMTTTGSMLLGASVTQDAATRLVGALDGLAVFNRSMEAAEVAGWWTDPNLGGPSSGRVGTATVTVVATAQTPPTFATATASATIAENAATSWIVVGTDADLPAQTLSYSLIAGGDAALFQINASTGELSFRSAPDYEAPRDLGGNNVYQFTVAVSDGSASARQDWTVTVTPVNEHAPTITSDGGAALVSRTVYENQTAIATLSATDADRSAVPTALKWSIDATGDGLLFDINETTGALSWRAAPDAEAPPPPTGNDGLYRLRVLVRDDDGLQDAQDWTIALRSVNDVAPVFVTPSSLQVDEKTTVAARLVAFDADVEPTNLAWSIVGGADSAAFTVNAATGELAFRQPPNRDAAAQDADGNDIYEVTVEVFDGVFRVQRHLSIEVLPVNDHDPVITSVATYDVDENTTVVTTLQASDPSDWGVTPTYTWSISGGADAGAFDLDPATGALSFKQPHDRDAAADDANQDYLYEVQVKVDDGGRTATQNLTIRLLPVSEFAPVITSPASLTINEGSTTVATLTVSDADRAETFTWSLVGGADRALFSINASTGALGFNAAPDYERPADADQNNVYDVQVAVTDSGGWQDLRTLSVQVQPVNDNAPVITGAVAGTPLALTVDEHATLLHQFTATDADLPGPTTLTWSLTGPDAAAFTIAADGTLRFQAPDRDAAAQDADQNYIYQVTVVVSDGQLTATQDVTVQVQPVNEHAPVIVGAVAGPPLALTVNEHQTLTRVFTATDADLPADTLTWSLSGADAANFSLVNGTLSFQAPDREAAPEDADQNYIYQITVQVSDGVHTTTQDVTVAILPVNESAPVITMPASFTVNEGVTRVAALTATDADLPAETLTWSLSGADADAFTIVDGALTFKSPPDRDAAASGGVDKASYQLRVSVFDGAHTASQDLSIAVLPINDSPPVIDGAVAGVPQVVEIDENTAVVGVFAATDADHLTTPTTLSWSVAGGADAAHFTIDAASGQLAFIAAPDKERPRDANGDGIYEVQVQVSDGTLVQQATVHVLVRDVNEDPIAIVRDTSAQPARVPADAPAGTVIDAGQWAKDPDATSTVTYAFDSDPAGRFEIDPATGEIRTLAPLTGAAGTTLQLDVRATSSDGSSQMATISVAVAPASVTVTLPAMSEDGTITITKDQLLGSNPPTVTAENLVVQAGNGTITVLPDGSGWVFTPAPDWSGTVVLGYELSDGQARTPSTVTLTVTPQPDAPLITIPGVVDPATGIATVTVVEESRIVTVLHGQDADGDPLTWSIAGGADAAHFTIDASGQLIFVGPVQFGAPADADGNNVYEVIVQASDGTLSAQQTLLVKVMPDPHAAAPAPAPAPVPLPAPTPAPAPLPLNPAPSPSPAPAPGPGPTTPTSAPTSAPLAAESGSAFGSSPLAGSSTSELLTQAPAAGTSKALDGTSSSDLATATPGLSGATAATGAGTTSAGAASLLGTSTPAGPIDLTLGAASLARDSTSGPSARSAQRSGSPSGDLPSAATFAELDAMRSDPSRLSDWIERGVQALSAAAATQTAWTLADTLRSSSFSQELQRIHDDVVGTISLERIELASAAAVSGGLSVGYVLWLTRGGVLMASLMSGMPVWSGMDPLPILSTLEADGSEDDDPLDEAEEGGGEADITGSNSASSPDSPSESHPKPPKPISADTAVERLFSRAHAAAQAPAASSAPSSSAIDA